MSLPDDLRAAFAERYGGAPPLLVRAPGRVNLIGEHTDYNDGFVLPMAIDRWLWVALRPRTDGRVRLASLEFGDAGELSLREPGPRAAGWLAYAQGVAWALREAGHALAGFDGVVAGDVPVGAGLASSAALQLALTRAFAAAAGFDWSPPAMAGVVRRAENGWIGVSCGIMDPLASACGREGHALLIDCRSLAVEPLPLPRGSAVVVLDTTTRRRLDATAYNERRAQCETAAAACGAAALREVDAERLEASRGGLDATVWRRARHVLSENQRTLEAAGALRRGDATALGGLMTESHRSLRDDFDVSTPALDAMVAAALGAEGCQGARLTGAGFGGCVVALVEAGCLPGFARQAAARYRAGSGLEARVLECRAAAGAELVACA